MTRSALQMSTEVSLTGDEKKNESFVEEVLDGLIYPNNDRAESDIWERLFERFKGWERSDKETEKIRKLRDARKKPRRGKRTDKEATRENIRGYEPCYETEEIHKKRRLLKKFGCSSIHELLSKVFKDLVVTLKRGKGKEGPRVFHFLKPTSDTICQQNRDLVKEALKKTAVIGKSATPKQLWDKILPSIGINNKNTPVATRTEFLREKLGTSFGFKKVDLLLSALYDMEDISFVKTEKGKVIRFEEAVNPQDQVRRSLNAHVAGKVFTADKAWKAIDRCAFMVAGGKVNISSANRRDRNSVIKAHLGIYAANLKTVIKTAYGEDFEKLMQLNTRKRKRSQKGGSMNAYPPAPPVLYWIKLKDGSGPPPPKPKPKPGSDDDSGKKGRKGKLSLRADKPRGKKESEKKPDQKRTKNQCEFSFRVDNADEKIALHILAKNAEPDADFKFMGKAGYAKKAGAVMERRGNVVKISVDVNRKDVPHLQEQLKDECKATDFKALGKEVGVKKAKNFYNKRNDDINPEEATDTSKKKTVHERRKEKEEAETKRKKEEKRQDWQKSKNKNKGAKRQKKGRGQDKRKR
mmetsp:Transcript_9932/g.15992  ORF Transcript_9932/g.15992 Transcript_9932/m.15992 type:complete len:579 (-) Transcript_9932:348-2084(-)